MVRKQLYLHQEHERLLKKTARETGLSEAELVRMALSRFFQETDLPLPGHVQALAAFLEEAGALSGQHHLPQGWQFDRQEAYPSETRWARGKG